MDIQERKKAIAKIRAKRIKARKNALALLASKNQSADFTPMEQDPEYQQWINEISKDCDCCATCGDVPCAGVMAGGLCDGHCRCEVE